MSAQYDEKYDSNAAPTPSRGVYWLPNLFTTGTLFGGFYAIVAAIDREAIVKVVYGPSAKVLRGLIPEGVPGAQADACGERCARNVERAKGLVAAAFAGKPVPEVAIDFDDDGTQRAVAQANQANLQEAGIPALLRPHTNADYLRFANMLVDEMGRQSRLVPRPHRSAGFAVLTAPDIPSVLIELGYLSSPQDAKLLGQPEHRVRMARSLLRSIDGYFAARSGISRS